MHHLLAKLTFKDIGGNMVCCLGCESTGGAAVAANGQLSFDFDDGWHAEL